MAKIVYGISGEGFGHAIRSRVLIEHLQKNHEIQIVAGGKAFVYLSKHFDNIIKVEFLKIEYIKLLIETGNSETALVQTQNLLGNLHSSLTRHFCSQCGFNSDEIFWRCPQCHKWETIQFRWKV